MLQESEFHIFPERQTEAEYKIHKIGESKKLINDLFDFIENGDSETSSDVFFSLRERVRNYNQENQ